MAELSGICLKWNNHHNFLASCLFSQLEEQNFIDVTLAAEGKYVNAHRLILCSSSPYFKDLLEQFHKPAIIILQNVKFSDLKLLVEYMYKGEVSVSDNQLDSFLEAAKNLQIKGLTQKGNNLDAIKELTVTVKTPVEKAVESADYPIIDNHQETNLNPAPVLLEECVIKEEQIPYQLEMKNQDMDSHGQIEMKNPDMNSISDSSDDEERDPIANGYNSENRPIQGVFYKCGACGRDYQSGYYLSRHTQKGNCRSLPYFRCAVCGVCYDTRGACRYHISNSGCLKHVSPAELDANIIETKPTFPKYRCNLCSRRFQSREKLRLHKKYDHGEK